MLRFRIAQWVVALLALLVSSVSAHPALEGRASPGGEVSLNPGWTYNCATKVLSGTLSLKNLDFNKAAIVVYADKAFNWKATNTITAYYISGPSWAGIEQWGFRGVINDDGISQFYIKYLVNRRVYFDTNGGPQYNYRVQTICPSPSPSPRPSPPPPSPRPSPPPSSAPSPPPSSAPSPPPSSAPSPPPSSAFSPPPSSAPSPPPSSAPSPPSESPSESPLPSESPSESPPSLSSEPPSSSPSESPLESASETTSSLPLPTSITPIEDNIWDKLLQARDNNVREPAYGSASRFIEYMQLYWRDGVDMLRSKAGEYTILIPAANLLSDVEPLLMQRYLKLHVLKTRFDILREGQREVAVTKSVQSFAEVPETLPPGANRTGFNNVILKYTPGTKASVYYPPSVTSGSLTQLGVLNTVEFNARVEYRKLETTGANGIVWPLSGMIEPAPPLLDSLARISTVSRNYTFLINQDVTLKKDFENYGNVTIFAWADDLPLRNKNLTSLDGIRNTVCENVWFSPEETATQYQCNPPVLVAQIIVNPTSNSTNSTEPPAEINYVTTLKRPNSDRPWLISRPGYTGTISQPIPVSAGVMYLVKTNPVVAPKSRRRARVVAGI